MNTRHSLRRGALLLVACISCLAGTASAERLKVVATIPDLGNIVQEIGGDEVDVQVIARGAYNLHAVPIKPSHIIATSRAEVFVQVGLALEHSWVPALLLASRNRRIEPGQPGFVTVSEGWEAINVPATTSRQQGADVHPFGNPHMNLDPAAGAHMAERVLAALAGLRPERSEYFQARHTQYLRALEQAQVRWAKMMEGLVGQKVVVYHQEFTYLLQACGIETVATLEPKPGVPPTPSHVARVAQAMEADGVELLLTAKWSNNTQVAGLAKRSNASVIELPAMVDSADGTDTWIEMMDLCLTRLRRGFDLPVVPR